MSFCEHPSMSIESGSDIFIFRCRIFLAEKEKVPIPRRATPETGRGDLLSTRGPEPYNYRKIFLSPEIFCKDTNFPPTNNGWE